MAADDELQDGPSLAPPSLGFGLRRRKKPEAPVVEDDAPTAVIPAPAPPAQPVPDPEPAPVHEPDPIPDPDPAPSPMPEPEPAFLTQALTPVEVPPPAAVKPAKPPRVPSPPKEPKAPAAAKPARTVPDLSAPEWLTGWIAVLVAGAVVGLVVVAGTAGAQQACSAVRGTGTCGGGPGFVLLVAIIVVATFVGIAVLRLAGVDDAVSTSLLAIGVMAVLVVLFLLGSIGSWWMVIAVPLISVASYALSYWVATTFSEVQPD